MLVARRVTWAYRQGENDLARFCLAKPAFLHQMLVQLAALSEFEHEVVTLPALKPFLQTDDVAACQVQGCVRSCLVPRPLGSASAATAIRLSTHGCLRVSSAFCRLTWVGLSTMLLSMILMATVSPVSSETARLTSP